MSAITLLGAVQAVCLEIGIPAPTTCIGSVAQQVKQLVAYANVTGDALRDEADWSVLRKLATITTISGTPGYTVAGQDGATVLPCSRIIQETGWDSTNSWYFAGSVTDTEWNALTYGIGTSPLRKVWRTTDDDEIEIFPTPTANGDLLKISFVTSYWAKTNGNVFKAVLEADDDYHLFNDRLFILGIKWRFLEQKGLPFGAVKAEFDRILGVRKAAARTARTLTLDGKRARSRHFVDFRNVPPTGFGT